MSLPFFRLLLLSPSVTRFTLSTKLVKLHEWSRLPAALASSIVVSWPIVEGCLLSDCFRRFGFSSHRFKQNFPFRVAGTVWFSKPLVGSGRSKTWFTGVSRSRVLQSSFQRSVPGFPNRRRQLCLINLKIAKFFFIKKHLFFPAKDKAFNSNSLHKIKKHKKNFKKCTFFND